MKNNTKTVAGYISAQPKPIQPMLRQLRGLILRVAPKAEEKISYSMPFYNYYGRLAYFAGFKDHVSLFAMPPIAAKYKDKLNVTGKATIRFEIGQKLPVKIILELLKAGAQRNLARGKVKTCSRGHKFSGVGTCPVCWPGKKLKK